MAFWVRVLGFNLSSQCLIRKASAASCQSSNHISIFYICCHSGMTVNNILSRCVSSIIILSHAWSSFHYDCYACDKVKWHVHEAGVQFNWQLYSLHCKFLITMSCCKPCQEISVAKQVQSVHEGTELPNELFIFHQEAHAGASPSWKGARANIDLLR